MRRDGVHWNIETEREDDGRWIAEVVAVPGVILHGATEDDARGKACALASAATSSAATGL
jgi:predicted RNase H-like HicB family nuclease